jgi:uncharacterized protein YkwD
VEWTRRIVGGVALGLVAAGAGLGLASAPAFAQVEPTLRILDVRLGKPAVVGRDTSLIVDAVDSRAAVNGMVVSFGRGSVFGISACRPPDSSGRLPAAPFAPGSRVRLTAPHRFRRKRARRVLVRVDSGGCEPLTSLLQPLTVTPTAPNQRPSPLIVSPPSLPPGGGVLPPIPSQPSTAPQPSAPPVPDALALPARQGCRGSGRRVRRSAQSLRQARRALLCLLNKTRRAHGLSRLRGNGPLLRAAEEHSRSMVVRHFFSHVDPSGRSALQRILRVGYVNGRRGWAYGENIGFGEGPASTPRHMMRAWMNSTPHRANILAGSFREVGLGVVAGIPGRAGARGATYTTVFGVRR